MLSKKTQYALKALGYLAGKYGDGPVLISEISRKKKIPIKFLETILLELKHALLPCVSLNFYEKCKDCNEAVCGLNKVMAQTRDATLKILGKKTLAELVDE
jgi:DNA-binding IscR family transcriptional regulator